MKSSIEQIASRARQLTGSLPHGEACFQACREMGVEDSNLAAMASIVSSVVTMEEFNAAAPARILSTRERLKLRPADRTEGDEVVLVFKRRHEVRMPCFEWERLLDTKLEPHAFVFHRLKTKCWLSEDLGGEK